MPSKDSKKKVILIDDNHSDGVVIRRYLEPDHIFQHILDEDIIIQEISKNPPDCILIDYHLVSSSGLEILTALTKVNFGKPIAYIVLTGEGNLDIAHEIHENRRSRFYNQGRSDQGIIGQGLLR